jgi:hypothetical protein
MPISDEDNKSGRVRAAAAELGAQGLSFHGRQVAASADLPIAHTRVYLRRLAQSGEIERLGRDLFRAGRGRPGVLRAARLRPPAQEVVDAIQADGVPALLSGLDILAPWTNQVADDDGSDLLIIADRGSGEAVEDALLGRVELVVNDPSSEQLALLAARRGSPVAVVRERALDDRALASGDGRRRPEEAWTDLVAEARRGWPIGAGELAAILRAMAVDSPSWTHLVRAARRRNMPMQLDATAAVPVRVAPTDAFWSALASELRAPA